MIIRRRFTGLLALLVALGLGLTMLASPLRADASSLNRQHVLYRSSDATIANPSRGFYHTAETHYLDAKGTGYEPLDLATLRSWRKEGVTQLLREWVLEYNAGADGAWNLTPDFLRRLDHDFSIARKAGVKIIIRFEYVGEPGEGWPPPTPYGDAPVPRTLHNIRQLGPTLRANADVIETVQLGFIGIWGEGYYTDYFADPADPSVVTEKNWADRTKVLTTLLHQLPQGITVDVRTPQMKQKAFDVPTGRAGALTPRQAYSGSDRSRVGHHNDCFLASPDDYGTFVSDPITLDEGYLAADSRYVPVGGETCNVNPPKSAWPSAKMIMERFHYSYLNSEYNTDVLDSWGKAGLKQATDRLGYRFVLRAASLPKTARAGERTSATIAISNVGFAAPFQRSDVQLVLTDGQHSYRLPIKADTRRWAAGRLTVVHAHVRIPAGAPAGHYRLALAMPSSYDSLAHRPAYAIRTANAGTWDARHGWNWLHASVRVVR